MSHPGNDQIIDQLRDELAFDLDEIIEIHHMIQDESYTPSIEFQDKIHTILEMANFPDLLSRQP